MGIFDNGPLTTDELKSSPITLYPGSPEPKRARRNTVRIIATRVSDGYRWEFAGWKEVERLGFDRMAIINSLMPTLNGNAKNYVPAHTPYLGFRWRVIDPQTHPVPSDTYYSPF